MVQGTTSDAGKSTIVAGLCRLLKRKGVRVVPFKPQNMALNSAVTADHGEIGRAQALQAQAAGIEPIADMNPVLLKPATDTEAQIVVQGAAVANMNARQFHAFKSIALGAVMESYERLRRQFDMVVVEGAGSPAEVNLRDNDIANMGFANAADCRTLIVADIDRGGVFAHLVGTLECLSAGERRRVAGFIINRFRGDLSLLEPGIEWLQERTGKPVFGVLPYLHGLHLDAEDAIEVDRVRGGGAGSRLRVAVPVFPRISNHTDFDALRAHPQVAFEFVGPGMRIPAADLVILPGSKSVQSDLAWMREQGWEVSLNRHLRYGGKLIAICGGMQMLGTALHDPQGIEGSAGSVPGLGLLEYETTLQGRKHLENVSGTLRLPGTPRFRGYEIHMGATEGPALRRPALDVAERAEGALSSDGQILATYVHGLFDEPESCAALLSWAGLERPMRIDHAELREQSIDRLADAMAASLDLGKLFARTLTPWTTTA